MRYIRTGLIGLIMAAAMFWMAPKITAQSASQIVLSCTTPAPESNNTNGCTSTQTVPIPSAKNAEGLFVAGFWVWCQSPAGSPTPYGPDCAGSMYVAEIDFATGAVVYEATSVDGHSSQISPAELQVQVTSSDGDVSCTLDVPASPTKTGTTLSGTCNGVGITFGDAVVHVTH